jgi:hypothetical protein
MPDSKKTIFKKKMTMIKDSPGALTKKDLKTMP